MGDLVAALPVLKWIGVGAGGTGAVYAVFQFWVYMSIKGNKESIAGNSAEIKKYADQTQDQETSIQVMSNTQKTMGAMQKSMDKKLDRLISLHLNGRKES